MREKLISILITTIIILAPTAMWVTSDKFNLPKMFVLLAGGIVLIVLMLSNYKKLNFDKKDFLILFFLLWGFISAINSGDYKSCFIGQGNRYDGWFVICSYIIIYMCAKKFLKYKNKNTLLVVLQVVYIIISILGITQYFTKNSLKFLYPIFGHGVSGSFGNTNFMGSFISIGMPIFIITYIIKGNKLSFITSLLTFFCLLTCLARSAWLAFAAFCIILIIYLIKNINKKYIIRTGILLVCFITIFMGTYYSKNVKLKKQINKVKTEVKTATTQGIKEKMGSNRIKVWLISLDLIKQYPILGVGTENFYNGVKENLTERSLNYMLDKGKKLDKAHNEYLHITATMGIPAIIIYGIFLTLIILPKLKDMFKKDITFINLSVIFSYSVQAFFNISTIGVAPLFWISLAVIDNKEINPD